MIEQINNSVKFLAFFTATKTGKTGLADVTVDVYNPAGSEIVTGGTATELGDGLYTYVLAANLVTTVGEYPAVFKTADATVDQKHIPSLWVVGRAGVEYLVAPTDPLDSPVPGDYASGTAGAALGRVGTAEITASVPAGSSGTLEFMRGDDYLLASGRHFTFTGDSWPDLTSADPIEMTIRRRREAFGTGSDGILLNVEDVANSRIAGIGVQTIVFELTSTDTRNLLPGTGTGKYDIQATFTVGNTSEIITLATGVVNVTEDQTR
jgi:hypothetical protein